MQKEHNSLLTLRDLLVLASFLALPGINPHLTLDRDAFHEQVGCVLVQEQSNWTEKTFCYWLRTLKVALQGYDTTNCKFLAVIQAVLLLHL